MTHRQRAFDHDGHEMAAMRRRGADVRDRRCCLGGQLSGLGEAGAPGRLIQKIRLRLFRPEGVGRGRANSQPRRQTAGAARIQRQARGNTDDGDLHRLASALLQERGCGSIRQASEADCRDNLRWAKLSLPGADNELLQSHRAVSRRTGNFKHGVEGKQRRHKIGRRGRIHNIAADGCDVSDLMATDDTRRLDQAGQTALEGRMEFDRPIIGERSQRIAVGGLSDPDQTRQLPEIDQMVRRYFLAVDLDHQIGAAGDIARRGRKPGCQADGLGNRRGSVQVEAHARPYSAAWTAGQTSEPNLEIVSSIVPPSAANGMTMTLSTPARRNSITCAVTSATSPATVKDVTWRSVTCGSSGRYGAQPDA